MPSYSESLIPSARAAKDASATGSSTQTSLVCQVVNAMVTACDGSSYTISTSVVGATTVDLQFVLEVLHTSGFDAAISGSNLVVSWAGA